MPWVALHSGKLQSKGIGANLSQKRKCLLQQMWYTREDGHILHTNDWISRLDAF